MPCTHAPAPEKGPAHPMGTGFPCLCWRASPHGSLNAIYGMLCCWRAGVWGGLGAGAPAYSGSLPYRCAASTPGALCVRILPLREGGLHGRWSRYTDLCHGKAASLVTGCAVDPTTLVVNVICLLTLLTLLRLATVDRHVSLLHAKNRIRHPISFPCHNMCCGLDKLWSALSVFQDCWDASDWQ